MRKTFLLQLALFLFLLPKTILAQKPGIEFYKGDFESAIELAKKEKKKIFIDFYTEWCGPCLNMALDVFPLPQVGQVYNDNFINLKIDAEKGEGRELAKRFEVRFYPTYVFLDPKTEEIVHRSGGNKSFEYFLSDAEAAMNPKVGSVFLEKKFKKGGWSTDFLFDYIYFKQRSGASREVPTLFGQLIERGESLTDPKVWDIFEECVSGYDNPYIKEVSERYDEFVSLYGKERVDQKLASATRWANDEVLSTFVDFNGKVQNMKLNKLSRLYRSENLQEAYDLTDELLQDSDIDQKELLRSLSFSVRVMPKYGLEEMSFEELAKKVYYLRYIAYNNYVRDDAHIHQSYALALECLISRAAKENRDIPNYIYSVPVVGKSDYDMRHPLLKQKPRRR